MAKPSIKRLVIVGAVVLAVGIGAGMVLLPRLAHPVSSTRTPVPTAPPFTAENQRQLEVAINSPAIADQAAALSADIRTEFMQQGQPVVPAGTHISLLRDTWQAQDQTATVEAEVSGSPNVIVHLVLENGSWAMMYTEDKS